MKLIVSSIVRNEASRHLNRYIANLVDILSHQPSLYVVTDDCSDDDTLTMLQPLTDCWRKNERPKFWKHEGRARQQHVDFVGEFAEEGDWVLALDADETISHPTTLTETIKRADKLFPPSAILLPLYEFWTNTEYRVDGYWFGTLASRLYRWQPDAVIADREMGCGSEPTYVQDGSHTSQDTHRLLHWGYLRMEDRVRKHQLYTDRQGGHGHSNPHVESIITEPTLRAYEEVSNA